MIAVNKDVVIPEDLIGDGPNWLHNKAAAKLGADLADWIWWKTEKPKEPAVTLEDILDHDAPFDKDDVLQLGPQRMIDQLNSYDHMVATGYRRTRNGSQQLELRFDGIAGCLRTPAGGSSKQYVIIRDHGVNHNTIPGDGSVY